MNDGPAYRSPGPVPVIPSSSGFTRSAKAVAVADNGEVINLAVLLQAFFASTPVAATAVDATGIEWH
jgi:hypothetical protein